MKKLLLLVWLVTLYCNPFEAEKELKAQAEIMYWKYSFQYDWAQTEVNIVGIINYRIRNVGDLDIESYRLTVSLEYLRDDSTTYTEREYIERSLGIYLTGNETREDNYLLDVEHEIKNVKINQIELNCL